MKNIIKSALLIISFSVVFTACQDDEYDAPNTFSDAGFIHSGFRSDMIRLNIDNYASFSDMSQGAVEHSWTIEPGSFFLQGPIDRRDTIFDKFIKTPILQESEDKTVHVLFKEGGLKKVRLFNVFDEYVEVRGAEDYIFPAKEIDGKFVIDTTLFVDVYNKIVPEMLIRQDGAVVSHTDSTTVITVEAGQSLEFVDMTSIGRPTNRYFNIAGSQYTDSLSVIPFYKLGNYRGTFRVTREDQSLPNGAAFYRIPATIKVIPSSLPFELAGDIMEAENQTIHVPFTGEFAPFGDQKAYFSVNVAGQPQIGIESISINAQNATILDIKLTETIYRNDVITLSYDGNGTLESTDTRKPVAFTDVPVKMFQHIIKHYDFESGEDDWEGKTVNSGWYNTKGASNFSTEQALSGTQSMKMVANGGNFSGFRTITDTFTLTAGTKIDMLFHVYKVDNTFPMMAPWLIRPTATITQFWDNQINAAPVKQWKQIKLNKIFTVGATHDDYCWWVRTNGTGTVYIDDVLIRVADDR